MAKIVVLASTMTVTNHLHSTLTVLSGFFNLLPTIDEGGTWISARVLRDFGNP